MKNIVRFNTDLKYGLSNEQVKKRIEDNLINYDTNVPTRSIKNIVSGNIFTLFNLLNIILALAIILVGSYKNLLFMGVVISNIIISTFQEIQAKRTIDKLSLIASTKVNCIRNGIIEQININNIVLDDLIIFKTGNQVVTDCVILEGSCEVNEAFITGESDPVYKKKGDMILSGSFIVSGNIKAKVEHIGKDNYTSSISCGAKYIKKCNSEILYSLKKVIKYVSIAIIPIGLLLFYNQYTMVDSNLSDTVVNTVAALLGMIPEGLILLTSTVFAISVLRLSKYKVLVQDLYCTEALARVDVLCLDKTGTLTEGNMEVSGIIPISNNSYQEFDEIICNLITSLNDDNSTFNAIKKDFNKEGHWIPKIIIPFSSKRKFSGVNFEKYGTYIMGAPEIILKDNISKIHNELEKYSKDNRLILLAHSKNEFSNDKLPNNIKPLALILIHDKIRKSAEKTLKYFEDSNVNLKIISGDNILTISSIAKRVGIDIKDKYIDATKFKNSDDIRNAVEKYSIFGRVTPFQKKEIILALKENGHTVGMVGDGVNDVLALKEADCSIAMSNGSDAARNVSQLVLLDSNFDSIPKIVKEGRRSINNIQRSASLFLVKTIYATILALIFLFINMSYPFEPIQLTLTSVATIGIPSFVLALEKNKERVKGNFLVNVISKALPTALTIVSNIILIMIISTLIEIDADKTSTLCVILTGFTGFMLLYKLCIPFNLIRRLLMVSMCTIFVIGILGLRKLFSLTLITPNMLILIIILVLCSIIIFEVINKLSKHIINKYRNKFI